jgi:putative transcriptional regulator
VKSELAPCFLVAMDNIVDPNFRRSVVLVLEHDDDSGAIGLIVNRETDYPAASLCDNLDLHWRGEADACVGWGGPVGEETGWVLLGDAAAEGTDAVPVAAGLHWSRSLESLRRVADTPSLPSRIYLGYAGWETGQLEHEIADGAWLVVPIREKLVFDTALDDMWGDAVRILGIEPATLVSTQGVN